jgi:hypothetical protein
MLIVSQVALGMLLVLNLGLTLALIRRVNDGSNTSTLAGLQQGARLPEFTAETLAGRQVSHVDFMESAAFIFIAPNCGPCREALPEYVRLSSLAQARGTSLVLVSAGDRDSTESMVGADCAVPVLIAPREIFDRFLVRGTPYLTVVKSGKIVSTGLANVNATAWKALVAMWEEGQRESATASPIATT